MRIPDTVGEFLAMTEQPMVAPDPFLGVKTSDHLPGYYSAAAAAAGILTLCTGKSDLVIIAGVIALGIVSLGCAILNARVVTERNATIRVHTATSAGAEIQTEDE